MAKSIKRRVQFESMTASSFNINRPLVHKNCWLLYYFLKTYAQIDVNFYDWYVVSDI